MDKEEEYRANLFLIDSLFCEVNFEDNRILCRSRKTALDTWRLSCSNGVNCFWEYELDFDAVVKHRKSIGMEQESYHSYFDRFRNAFQNDRIILEQSHNNHNELLFNVWCSISDREISYTFKLPKFTSEEFSERNSRLMFEMLIVLKRSLAALEERKKIDEKNNKELFEFKHPSSPLKSVSDYEFSSTSHSGKQSPKKSKNLKRKPGFSLLNPNVKRIVPKGAKIGEDCTPPNPSRTNPQISDVQDY